MNSVIIIPARGGSKSIPKKNIKPLNGKPLIAYSLESAYDYYPNTNKDFPPKVWVSSDSDEILWIVKNLGYNCGLSKCPDELATDSAKTDDVLIYTVNKIECLFDKSIDIIILLQPTSPIRPPGIIEGMMLEYRAGGYDSMLTVELWHGFLWARDGEDSAYSYDNKLRLMRQDQDTVYRETGSVYITDRKMLEETGCRICGKIGLHETRGIYSLEIDEPEDFDLMEKWIKGAGN